MEPAPARPDRRRRVVGAMTPCDYSPRVRPARVSQQTGTWSRKLDDLMQVGFLPDSTLRFMRRVDDARREHGSVTVNQAAKISEIWDEKVKT